ncbi:putative ribonuclease H-like domain-containing protein [Tanacetum coccineum]
MEAGTTITTLTAKLPILNPAEYDLWLIRIEQYFLMTDYSLWEVIKNGNKVLKRTIRTIEQIYEPTSTEEKLDRKNEMKARGTLLMVLLNKDQFKFHSYQDTKLLMEDIEKRYGGNKESKKVQKTLLKKQYENFAASSSKTLDQTFDWLQKLIGQLEIQGELLRRLPSEWKTHALIWRNKAEIETISLDDFTSSTTETDNTATGVSAAYTQFNIVNSTSVDNLSDVVICAFLMVMLTIRARRFIKRTSRNLDINSERIGFDMSKVECFNFHKHGHFARECRAPKNQEYRGRDYGRKTVPVENTTENALIAQDRIGGYDWSYQADEEHPTNFALMAYTSSGSSSSLDSEFNLVSYKAGLQSVEERLVQYKKNEIVLEEKINVLNLEVKLRDNALVENQKKLEKAESERDELKLTLEKFQSSSKSLNNLLDSQVMYSLEQRLGYMKSMRDIMQFPTTFLGNVSLPPKPVSKVVVETNTVRKNSFGPPIIEDWNSNDDREEEFTPNTTHLHKVCDKKVVRHVWNKSNRVNHKNFANKLTHPHPKRGFVPQAVLTRTDKINTAGASVNTIVKQVNTADPKTTVNYSRTNLNAFKRGYSHHTRSFNKFSENKNSIFNKKVNTVSVKDSTARHRTVVSENMGQKVNAVKATACWIWKAKSSSASTTFKKYSYIDARSRSKHMTGNKSYLTEYEDYDGGLVSFGDGKGRISGKVLLRVPRNDNIYSIDLKSVVPTGGLTCLFAKATIDESNLWHRRLGHINYKTMNKLVRGNLVRGLPSKIFENDHSCVAYQKGKQHKASYKAKLVNSISKSLHMLHMDLFGPINVKSLMKKSYCLVVTDDFSRFSWVFFLATKDETSEILKTFITGIENQLDSKVKVIRCDNGTEFKNSVINQFCDMKGIKREFSVARTPQQNGVAERKNRTLIKAARTMLVDSKLPTTFWAEAVNTACYVLNRALVIKPHNKTPYELIRGRPPLIDFMKPFGYLVTILNTRDHLGKFDGKADKGFFVGYSVNSKAMRVFKRRTRIVEETLNIRFLKNSPNMKGNGTDWLFDIDSLTKSMNYVPVVAGYQANNIVGTKDNIVAGQDDAGLKPTEVNEGRAFDNNEKDGQDARSESERIIQKEKQTENTNITNTVNTAEPSFDYDDSINHQINTYC